jgi:hypothetical protein
MTILIPVLAGIGAWCMSNPARRKRRAKHRRGKRRNPSDEARELELYIVNDSGLYRQSVQPVIKNLAKKMKKGTYDAAKALKLWGYTAGFGAQKYTKEFTGSGSGSEWAHGSYGAFSPADRKEVAKGLAEYYADELKEAAGLGTNPRRRARRSKRRGRC